MPLYQSSPAAMGEKRGVGAPTGVSLTTTSAWTALPPGSQWLSLSPRNFSTAVVARYQFCPYLTILKNQDALVTQPVDASFLLQDGSTTVTLGMNDFDTLANGDALYIGSHTQFAGLYVDVQNTNSNANDIAAVYTNGGGGLTTLSVTDNTDTGASLAQDATITWTVPAAWAAIPFNKAFNCDYRGYVYEQPRYWIRLSWSAAFDSTVSINQIFGINRSSAYAELASGQTWEETIRNGLNGISGVEALTDAGTANLVIQAAVYGRAKFASVAADALS